MRRSRLSDRILSRNACVSALVASVLLGSPLLGASEAAAQDAGEPSSYLTAETPVPFGYQYGEFETTRAASMGGALRAAGNGTTAPFLNPAAMTLTRVYHLEAYGQGTPETARHAYGGVIVDSITNKLAGGLAVSGGFLDSGEASTSIDRSWIDVRLALAYPFGDVVSVGLGGRFFKLTENGYGPLGESKASGGLEEDEGRAAMQNIPTLDAGFTVRAGEMVVLGVSGQNLTFPDDGILPTTLGGGVAVATENFTIEADGVADFTSYLEPVPRVMAGGELLVADAFPIRVGYRYDHGASSHALSAGLGYLSREFMVEAALRRTVAGPEATTFTLGLGYFLESSGLTGRGEEL
jgi:hypothetical protein